MKTEVLRLFVYYNQQLEAQISFRDSQKWQRKAANPVSLRSWYKWKASLLKQDWNNYSIIKLAED